MWRNSYSSLLKRITQLRWQVPILALFLVIVHQLIEHTILFGLSRWQHFTSQVLFYGVVGPALALWTLSSLEKSAIEIETAEGALKVAHKDLQESNERLEFLLRVKRRLAEADDDKMLVDIILDLPRDVVSAVGCSLIRYDERQKPMLAVHRGELSTEAFAAWDARVSELDLTARQMCEHCLTLCAVDSDTCPVLIINEQTADVKKVFCVELTRGKRKYGMLNIYLSNENQPSVQQSVLLGVMAQEISLALENLRLRSRELSTLFRLQQARSTKSLYAELRDVLDHILDALELDGGLLFLTESGSHELKVLAESGKQLQNSLGLVKGLVGNALQMNNPLIISDFEQQSDSELRSIFIAPMRTADDVFGALVFWGANPHHFSRRQIRLVDTVAGQAGLLLDNHRLYLQAEDRAALAERARLARDIHDGLAQTLGYVQLRLSKLNSTSLASAPPHFKKELDEVQGLIDVAYSDAREAIDRLHEQPKEGHFQKGIQKLLTEFCAYCAIEISMNDFPAIELPVMIQAQVLRITQEALENIRKHSGGTKAWMTWSSDENFLVLSIADNGRGFDPARVDGGGHYGLRIMRERAESIDADFQLISSLNEGAEIILRMPINFVEDELYA